VEVTAPVGAYREDIARVMHVETLQLRDEAPTVTERVTGIDLAYGAVGPAFGAQVPEIEAAIDAGAYTLDEAGLHLAGVDLDPGMYTVERERTYDGEGELIDAGGYACIVHQ
jgi:valyl-tRNA synthetase